MDDITPEQIARAAGLHQHHAIHGHSNKKPYWRARHARETGSLAVWYEYIGPDYPASPGACATDLLPVLEQRAEHKLDISKASSWGVWIDGWLPDNKEWPTWHEAICQAVVATQPKEQLT